MVVADENHTCDTLRHRSSQLFARQLQLFRLDEAAKKESWINCVVDSSMSRLCVNIAASGWHSAAIAVLSARGGVSTN